MNIIGYKCFNKDLINRYGFKYEIGKVYSVSGDIKFGNDGNGFHFCKNLEDTFRYFDAFNSDIDICLVTGFGNIITCEDTYYDYYDMYVSSSIILIKKLSREEIINYGYSLCVPRINRFISGILLTSDEIDKFKSKYYNKENVIKIIEYYQEGKLDTYTKKLIKK